MHDLRELKGPFDAILWDLDGTLCDTRGDLVTSVNALLRSYGRPELSADRVSHHIGRGARNLVARTLEEAGHPSLDSAEVERALTVFQEHYGRHLLDTTRAFDSLPETLRRLTERGQVMAVVTNKQEHLSRRILEGLDLLAPFRAVVGDSTTPFRKPDPRPVLHALELCGVPPAPGERVLLIGDSEIDVNAARNAGILCCGVLWGMGPNGALTDAAPDWIAETPAQLGAALLGDELPTGADQPGIGVVTSRNQSAKT